MSTMREAATELAAAIGRMEDATLEPTVEAIAGADA